MGRINELTAETIGNAVRRKYTMHGVSHLTPDEMNTLIRKQPKQLSPVKSQPLQPQQQQHSVHHPKQQLQQQQPRQQQQVCCSIFKCHNYFFIDINKPWDTVDNFRHKI